MGDPMMVFAALGGVIGTIFLGLLKDEVTAWMPWLHKLTLSVALRQVPEEQRERYEEEWASHIAEYPGNLSKLYQSMTMLMAGIRLKQRQKTVTFADVEGVLNKSIVASVVYWGTTFIGDTGTLLDYPLSMAHSISGLMCAWFTHIMFKYRRLVIEEFRGDLERLRRMP